jgi:dihydroneopterin aldolase
VTDPVPAALSVFMRGLAIEAEIGIYPYERGHAQPLVIDVELALTPVRVAHLTDTLNYETLVELARRLAATGHVELVETYAQRLAQACLDDPRVLSARVRVEKPRALAGAQAAGCEVVVSRR